MEPAKSIFHNKKVKSGNHFFPTVQRKQTIIALFIVITFNKSGKTGSYSAMKNLRLIGVFEQLQMVIIYHLP